jgi:uncharacterized protein YpiB (UPF0302 family)
MIISSLQGHFSCPLSEAALRVGVKWRHTVLKPKWEYIISRYSDNSHTVVYRDSMLKVQMQIVTKRSNQYNPEKAKAYFFIDNDKRTFYSEEELLNALSQAYDDQDRQRFSLILHWARTTED